MFLKLKSPLLIDSLVNVLFQEYKEDIIKYHLTQIKEESIREKSNIGTENIIHYYNAIYYTLIVKDDLDKNTQNDWNYFLNKYEIQNYFEKFGCKNISLKNLFTSIGLPINFNEEIFSDIGIGATSIQNTFVIEEINTTYYNVDIQDLLKQYDNCVNLVLGEQLNNFIDLPSDLQVVTPPNSQYYIYYVVSNNSGLNFSNLNLMQQDTFNNTVTVSLGDPGYKYIVIPSFIALTNIIDPLTGFIFAMSNVGSGNINGINYSVYRSDYYLNGSVQIKVTI